MEKALLIADQIMTEMGRTREVQEDLQRNGISTIVFSDVEPDPPVELVEKVGKIFTRNECRGIVAMERREFSGLVQGKPLSEYLSSGT